jgi:hypothetical protein
VSIRTIRTIRSAAIVNASTATGRPASTMTTPAVPLTSAGCAWPVHTCPGRRRRRRWASRASGRPPSADAADTLRTRPSALRSSPSSPPVHRSLPTQMTRQGRPM